MNENVKLMDLTVGQFKELLGEVFTHSKQSSTTEKVPTITPSLVHGIHGLAKLLGVSKRYAQELKSRGVFDGAITQVGRVITIYPDKALEIWDGMNQLK